MTIIRPLSSSEIALRSYIKDAAQKANLDLSEVNALNKKFGLELEYKPQGEYIHFTRYGYTKSDEFIKQCSQDALELSKKMGLAVRESIRHSSKDSLEMNLTSALQKMKNILKG